MRQTAIILVLFLAALVALAWRQGPATLQAGVQMSGQQLLRFMPILVLAMLLAGFAEVLIPAGFVDRWLTESAGWRGIVIAWAAGILTPGGSLMGMPLIVVLQQAGVGIGVLVTYMTSLALMSFVRMPLEIGFYGWRLAALRVAVSLLLPPIAGLLAQVLAPLFLKR